mmetsp:Transcript_3027/g.10932  ORF Transcript_3027/g.10932 Transcript_3027/m.10932 type:complete len:237 (-) Transcript_3027:2193-2903(-)
MYITQLLLMNYWRLNFSYMSRSSGRGAGLGRLRDIAVAKCLAHTSVASSDSSNAASAASRQIADKSAPVYPFVASAAMVRSTSSASGVFFNCTRKIASRSSAAVGGGTYNNRSKRPGRRSAASTKSGRFVAATTVTAADGKSPSISPKSCVMTRSCTEGAPPSPPPPRVPAKPSTSSMNITAGDDARARENTERTAFSESPTYLENNSEPLIEIKLRPDALATARASMVLLHPGGP